MTSPLPPVFCAIDTTDLDHAMALAAAMQKAGCGIKLGLEFFNAHGSKGVRDIRATYEELPLFLDLKFHDIPNTVAGAMRAVAPLQADFINLHASGGLAMMQTGREALHAEADRLGMKQPQILAVTILTSLDEQALEEIGYQPGVAQRVSQLAALSRLAGMDGVVCSAKEIAQLRGQYGPDFILMVPGIRPAGSDSFDQKRVLTPEEALQQGASHIVIGRPITGADNPEQAARAILKSLEKQAA